MLKNEIKYCEDSIGNPAYIGDTVAYNLSGEVHPGQIKDIKVTEEGIEKRVKIKIKNLHTNKESLIKTTGSLLSLENIHELKKN